MQPFLPEASNSKPVSPYSPTTPTTGKEQEQPKVCQITHQNIGPGDARLLRLENDWLAVTILPDKGADIYELIYKPQGLDVLWKSPWAGLNTSHKTNLIRTGLSQPTISPGTAVGWLEAYEGGWQELFPNGGDACSYAGAELPFHGEASWVGWDYEILAGSEKSAVAHLRLTTRLRRSPFRLERWLRLEANSPVLSIHERITNEGGEDLAYMWGQHPAFGAPFLGPGCRLDIPARHLQADADFDGPFNPLTPGECYEWPLLTASSSASPTLNALPDLSLLPPKDKPRQLLAYFTGFNENKAPESWYALTNPELGFGVGLVWSVETFPYAWFWQELNGSSGFPWYKSSYVMAVEPFTSWPAHGLVNVIEKTGTQCFLAAGETVETEFKVVFYETNSGVTRINQDGTVVLKEEKPNPNQIP